MGDYIAFFITFFQAFTVSKGAQWRDGRLYMTHSDVYNLNFLSRPVKRNISKHYSYVCGGVMAPEDYLIHVERN